jgi:hypothetical protein
MRWIIAGLAVLALVGFIGWQLVVPPTAGTGWRLDPDARWEEPIAPDDFLPSAVIYGWNEETIGIGITTYGSSSCPELLRRVEVRMSELIVETWKGLAAFGACTADAGPHRFGIVVDRDRIGPPPISVSVRGGDRPTEITTFERLP